MTEQIKILCVDEEREISKALQQLFSADNQYSIITAESGEDGLVIMDKEKNIRLVVSEYQLPGMNGIDFLCQVYKEYPETIRVVLSGYVDTAAVVDAVNLGRINKYIHKPWNDDELKEAISYALQHQELQLQNNQLNKELQQKNQQLQNVNVNLERLVDQRSEALEIRNRVLQVAQGILDVLPMVVFGIDPEDMIVHCNEYARDLFPYGGFGPLGNDRFDVFPEEVNALIDQLGCDRAAKANVKVLNRKYRAEVRRLHESLAQGLVLVLTPED